MDSENLEPLLDEIIQTQFEKIKVFNDCLDIAIIGKSGAGKSSFTNAFRGRKNDDEKCAPVSAKAEGKRIDLGKNRFEHSVKIKTMEYQINFYDTEGYLDDKNTDVREALESIKEHYKIDFDAIIFVTSERISSEEIKIAEENESKNVMIFFIYNKLDDFYEKTLKSKSLHKRKDTIYKMYSDNQKILETELYDNLNIIFDLIKDVFKSISEDLNKFNSEKLKSQKYKSDLIKSSVYLITSSCDDFEDEVLSPGGKRLRSEIENHLINIKFGNIDLMDPFSKRTIFLKKKNILSQLFDGKLLQMLLLSVTSIVPLLDMLPANRFKKSFREEFLNKFGIKELEDKFKTNRTSITTNEGKLRKLEIIFDKIAKDEAINKIDDILDTTSVTDLSTLKERIQNVLNNILPTIGITVASLSDDILAKLGTIGSTFASKSVILMSLATIPISMAIYFLLLQKSVETILLKCEEYALLIIETLHYD